MKKSFENYILCVCMMFMALPYASAQKKVQKDGVSDAWMEKMHEMVENSDAFKAVMASKADIDSTISKKLMKSIVFDDMYTSVDTLIGFFDLWVEGENGEFYVKSVPLQDTSSYSWVDGKLVITGELKDTTMLVTSTNLAIVYALERGTDIYKVNLFNENDDMIKSFRSTSPEDNLVSAKKDTTSVPNDTLALASSQKNKLDTVNTRFITDDLLVTTNRSTGEEFFFSKNKETGKWESIDPKAQVIKVGDRKRDPSFLLYDGELLAGNKKYSPRWGMGDYARSNYGLVSYPVYTAVYQPAFGQQFFSQPFGRGWGGNYGGCGYNSGFGFSANISFGFSGGYSCCNNGWAQNYSGGGLYGGSMPYWISDFNGGGYTVGVNTNGYNNYYYNNNYSGGNGGYNGYVQNSNVQDGATIASDKTLTRSGVPTAQEIALASEEARVTPTTRSASNSKEGVQPGASELAAASRTQNKPQPEVQPSASELAAATRTEQNQTAKNPIKETKPAGNATLQPSASELAAASRTQNKPQPEVQPSASELAAATRTEQIQQQTKLPAKDPRSANGDVLADNANTNSTQRGNTPIGNYSRGSVVIDQSDGVQSAPPARSLSSATPTPTPNAGVSRGSGNTTLITSNEGLRREEFQRVQADQHAMAERQRVAEAQAEAARQRANQARAQQQEQQRRAQNTGWNQPPQRTEQAPRTTPTRNSGTAAPSRQATRQATPAPSRTPVKLARR